MSVIPQKLGDMLASFVTDNLAALWDLHYPYRVCGETPEATVKNLGAYIRHIHLKDSESAEVHAIVGEGSLPLDRVMNALHSVNYDGFISIEWDPKWVAEVGGRSQFARRDLRTVRELHEPVRTRPRQGDPL